MEVREVKSDGNTILVELKGDTIGFANLIRDELWNDENVEESASVKEHPYMAEPKVFVKMKGRAQPQKALRDSANRVQVELKELRKEFETAFKK